MPSNRSATVAATALIAAGLLGLSTTTASAQPPGPPPVPPVVTVVPERPAQGGTTPFVANPGITDAHPQVVTSWSRLPNDRAIAVQFTTGTPECYGVAAEVQETPDLVAVKLRSGTLPGLGQRPCIMLAVFGTLDVPLANPVGNRAVLSIT